VEEYRVRAHAVGSKPDREGGGRQPDPDAITETNCKGVLAGIGQDAP